MAAHDGTGLAPWSNRGGWVRVAAPGDARLGRLPGPDVEASPEWAGTSFATPWVSAELARQVAAGGHLVDALAKVLADGTSEVVDPEYPG